MPSWLIEASGRLWDAERVGCKVLALDLEQSWVFVQGSSKRVGCLCGSEASEQALSSLESVMNAASELWSGSVVQETWSLPRRIGGPSCGQLDGHAKFGKLCGLESSGPRVSANRGTNGIDGTIGLCGGSGEGGR